MIYLIGEGEYSDYNVHAVVEGDVNPNTLKPEYAALYGFPIRRGAYGQPEFDKFYAEQTAAVQRARADLNVTDAELESVDAEHPLIYVRWLCLRKGFRSIPFENAHVGSYGNFDPSVEGS